mgnify:CR=1 FL=1
MSSRIVTYPDLEKEVHRYIKYLRDDNKYYVHCDEIVLNQNGIRCRCAMKPCREDHFKDWLKTHKHICTPGQPINQQTLKDMWSKTKDGKWKEKTDDEKGKNICEYDLHCSMAAFTGNKNLSLNILSSSEFYELACQFIAYGLSQNSNEPNPLCRAHLLFKQLHRDRLRSLMVRTAFNKHQEILQQFSKLPYVSLALDEGTTAKYQNLHFVLESPGSGLASYNCNTLRMKGGKAHHYVSTISFGMDLLNKANIRIGTAICDGNTAQKKAFNHDWNKSLYHQKISNFNNIIYIPCLCHRIDNSYKMQVFKNKKLGKIVSRLHDLSVELNEYSNNPRVICPTHCETRWIWDYEIVEFILNNREGIEANLSHLDVPFEKFEQLFKVLHIFKTLILIFENPNAKLQDAFLHLEHAINALFELNQKENNKYASCLAYSLQSYTIQSPDAGLWCLAYIFTPEGREDYRQRNIKQQNPPITGSLKFFSKTEIKDDDDNCDDIPEISLDDGLMTIDGEMIDTLSTSSSSDDEDCSESDDSDLAFEEEEKENPFINYLDCSKKKLRELLKWRSLSKKQIDICITCFNKYIDSSFEPFSSFKTSANEYSWIQIRNTVDGWNSLSDIALRLTTSGTSEASCERSIKKQRQIHTPYRMKSKKLLLDARSILSYSTKL